MAFIPQVADWSSSLVDGWTGSGVNEFYVWESRLAGGFWTVYQDLTITGFVQGVGYISGEVNVYYLTDIVGDVTGVGYIFSDISVPEALLISGFCQGVGEISSKFNFSRRRALYPQLRREVSYDWQDAPIVALEYVGFSPNKILNITSREDSLFENTSDFYLAETSAKSGDYFPVLHYPFIDNASGKIDYLVTDIRSDNQNGKALFYQYELLFDSYTIEDGETITLYRNNEIRIDPSQYVTQFSYDLLGDGVSRYSSTTWRQQDQSKKIHRIRILLPVDFANRDEFYTISYYKSVYGARTQQKELVELKPLYNQDIDYNIGSSGISVLSGGKINEETQTLYIVKDPEDRIKPIGIEPPVYQPDEISSWRLRLNPGTILTRSGIYNGEPEHFYYLPNRYSPTYYPITNVKPSLIAGDIIKLDQYPIYLDETKYTYPLYLVELYDKKDLSLTTDLGKVSIEVNGKSRTDFKILSADRKKGYFQLNEHLNPSDELELNFYVEPSGHVVIENLELNPKITDGDSLYNIRDFASGLGVALKEYNPSDDSTEHVWIYNSNLSEDSRTYYKVPQIGEPAETTPTGQFLTICEIDINRLSTDVVKATDARRIGGGIRDNKELNSWFSERPTVSPHEIDSYIGNAFYGGDPQSFGSTVIIHVPSGVLYASRQRWIDSLSGVVNDAIEQKERGTREFNFYLDQVIRRYISAGTDYMLIPITSSGTFGDIVSLDYDNSI